MQIKVSARHGHLSEENQQNIRAKAEKLLHFFDRITMIEVTCDMHEERKLKEHTVEIKVDAEHKHDFIAIDSHPDLLRAVDMAIDRIQHQVHKYKEKIQDHRRDPHLGKGPNT